MSLLSSMASASSLQMQGLQKVMQKNIQQSFGTFATGGTSMGSGQGVAAPRFSSVAPSLNSPSPAFGVGQRLNIIA